MKMTIKSTKNATHLWNIDSGELFRPVNSQKVYMKLWEELSENCWNENESRLYDYYENPQNHDVDDIHREGRACVDMENGIIVIFHKELQVVKLKYTMEVED